MNKDIHTYNALQSKSDQQICDLLMDVISKNLPEAESKVWHGHPVWFLEGNPVVGYAKLKESVQLLFWSGQSFAEVGLQSEGKFKAAQIRYTSIDQIDLTELKKWLKKAREIQWNYKDIVKFKGELKRLK